MAQGGAAEPRKHRGPPGSQRVHDVHAQHAAPIMSNSQCSLAHAQAQGDFRSVLCVCVTVVVCLLSTLLFVYFGTTTANVGKHSRHAHGASVHCQTDEPGAVERPRDLPPLQQEDPPGLPHHHPAAHEPPGPRQHADAAPAGVPRPPPAEVPRPPPAAVPGPRRPRGGLDPGLFVRWPEFLVARRGDRIHSTSPTASCGLQGGGARRMRFCLHCLHSASLVENTPSFVVGPWD